MVAPTVAPKLAFPVTVNGSFPEAVPSMVEANITVDAVKVGELPEASVTAELNCCVLVVRILAPTVDGPVNVALPSFVVAPIVPLMVKLPPKDSVSVPADPTTEPLALRVKVAWTLMSPANVEAAADAPPIVRSCAVKEPTPPTEPV